MGGAWKTEDAQAADLAERLMITEKKALSMVRKAVAAGIDPTSLRKGQNLPSLKSHHKVKAPATPSIANAAALFGDDPPAEKPKPVVSKAPPPPSSPAKTPLPVTTELHPELVKAARLQAKQLIAAREAMRDPDAAPDDLVDVGGGRMLNASLSRKQKLALLAEAIRDPELSVVDLVRAIGLHTEIAGDSGDGAVYELRIVLDDGK